MSSVKWKFDWNIPGFVAFRNSGPVQQWVLGEAQKGAGRAGPGYTADVQPGRTRAQARIHVTDFEALAENMRHNTILKAGGGGA